MFSQKDIDTAVKIVKNIHVPYEFGCDADGYFYTDTIVDQLINAGYSDDDFDIDYGISKVVIIFKNLSFVIKIPFHGKWYDEWDEDYEEYYNKFEPFYCANSSNYDDYCEAEVDAINEMICFGFEAIIAEEICIGEYNHTLFYIQEKVKKYNCSTRYTPSYDSLTKARNLKYYYEYCDENWRASVIELYGEEYWTNFVDWVDNGHNFILNDMHDGNYGYNYKGLPVLFDVSGYEG